LENFVINKPKFSQFISSNLYFTDDRCELPQMARLKYVLVD